MKKKNLLLVLMSTMLVSCDIEIFNSNSNSEVKFDETILNGKESVTDLYDVDSLFLNNGETYNLDVMKISSNDYTLTVEDSNVVSYEDGILTGKEVGSGNKKETYIYAYNDTKYQKIKVTVGDNDAYHTYFSTIDKGRLYGKNIIFFGDSITHSWTRCGWGSKLDPSDKDYNQYIANWNTYKDIIGDETNYTKLLDNECHFNKGVNAAWSGGTISYLPSSTERYTYKCLPYCVDEHREEIKDMDFAFVFYGTNDLTDGIEIGSPNDYMEEMDDNDYSFIGSLSYSMDLLREINPNIKIYVLTILNRSYLASGATTVSKVAEKVEAYNQAIKDMSEVYLYNVIDTCSLYEPTNANFSKYLNSDGLHPNADGHKLIANYILKGKK